MKKSVFFVSCKKDADYVLENPYLYTDKQVKAAEAYVAKNA